MLFAPKANARIKYLIAYLNKKEIAFPTKGSIKSIKVKKVKDKILIATQRPLQGNMAIPF